MPGHRSQVPTASGADGRQHSGTSGKPICLCLLGVTGGPPEILHHLFEFSDGGAHSRAHRSIVRSARGDGVAAAPVPEPEGAG